MGLYVADRHGSHARRIAGIGYSPTWSPDGRRLAYVREGRVVIVRADGSHARELKLRDVWQVAWSPTGRDLLLSRGATAASLELVRPDGSGLRTVVRAPAGDAYLMPTWAPDGRRIAYQHDQNCVGTTCGSGPIELADLNGHVFATIDGFYPSWSPSGRSIAYGTGDGVFVRSLVDRSTRRVFSGTLETTGIAWAARPR